MNMEAVRHCLPCIAERVFLCLCYDNEPTALLAISSLQFVWLDRAEGQTGTRSLSSAAPVLGTRNEWVSARS
jgi:hypothetical protein